MTPRDEIKALLHQKELFIFDLDGTLFNTLGDLAPAVNYAMKQFGLKTHSNDDVRTFIGNGSMNLIRRAVAANYVGMENIRDIEKVAAVLEREGYSDESVKGIHKVYSDYYWEHCTENTEPYEGVVELIKRIAQSAGCDRDSAGSFNRNEDCAGNDKNSAESNGYCAGAKCAAMLTNKPVAPAQKILEKFGLENSFATYLCGDTTPERKPSPAGIFEILRQTGIAPKKAIMIGVRPLSPRYTTGHIKDFAKFID